MRLTGCLLLLSGWLILLAALLLLAPTVIRTAFVAAGLLVEAVGLTALAKEYIAIERNAHTTRSGQRSLP